MTSTVNERLSRAQAQERGLIPPHHRWDEELQQPIPIGMAVAAEQLERPVDLEQNLASFDRNRRTLMNFVAKYLQEAEYADGKGKERKGSLVPGKLHDYYKVPGSDNKALTKLGAEKLCQLFRLGRGSSRVVACVETKEYVSATVEVVLTDQYRREVGSAVGSASTAEAGFRSVFAQKKYGATLKKEPDGSLVVDTPADFRAALNDVIARANKRAFVQAVLVASSADEVFVAGEEAEHKPGPEEQERPKETAPAAGPLLPNAPALKQYAGKPIRELATAELSKIHAALRTNGKAIWQPVIDALAEELDRRSQDALAQNQEDLGL